MQRASGEEIEEATPYLWWSKTPPAEIAGAASATPWLASALAMTCSQTWAFR
jgi:hypothetical protein